MKMRHLLFTVAILLITLTAARYKRPPPVPPPAGKLLTKQRNRPPATTPIPTPTPKPTPPFPPTLADFWDGRADFVVEVADTGLPMGESDTLAISGDEVWSYAHASARSAGVVDQCGDPVPFPGCTVIYRSHDGGRTFQLESPVCQFQCVRCPCDAPTDHHVQQQYPRVAFNARHDQLWLVYEYLAHVMLRRSADGLAWSRPERVAYSGLWSKTSGCEPAERIESHPHTAFGIEECLAGGPPGIFIAGEVAYIFVGLGQNPGSLGCFYGRIDDSATRFQPCTHNPLLTGAERYGPLDEKGPATHPFWNFRMLSAAEVHKIGARYYMLYEGLRGPGPGDAGDTQFGLGLARSLTDQIDGPWEQFPGNPILVDAPANIGVGHADLIVHNGETIVYTSLDGVTRSRLKLVWME